MSLKAIDTGFLRNLITYDASGNISLPAGLSIFVNKEVATKEYVDTQNSGQVLQSRTLTINGVVFDLSANRSWTINSMVYPSAGIALSSGTGWGTSIVNNSANWNTAFGWGNHALAGYLTSFTETDPTVPSHVKAITTTKISNWDTAFGWGNHALSGYLTSFTETDPTVPSHVKSITTTKISNWDAAYGWGNHASAGYEIASNKSNNAALGNSSTLYPTQAAVKSYVDSAVTGGVNIQGDWNASTNTPNISSTTTTGFTWRVSVSGTTNLGGISVWNVNDLAVKTAGGWIKIDNSSSVISVYGRQGVVVANTGDYNTSQVTESGDLYFTTARARASFSAGTNISIDANGVIASIYSYTLPTATSTILGGVKIGAGVTITAGVISVSTNYEAPIAAGTTAQYWRGDKTWQTLPTTIAWTSVTGRPTLLSQFTNDLGNYGSWITASGNAATSTTFSTGRTNYKGVTDNAVAGQLMWKNYGNNHTIFDASASTSPDGGAVNNTNAAVAWSATYPTLMGWNGASTYGVRVDSARVSDTSDSATYARYVYNAGFNGGNVGYVEPSGLYVTYATDSLRSTYAEIGKYVRNYTALGARNNEMTFYWAGQSGQPTWLWGSNNGTDIYVYNPSNFSVNYATTAGSATDSTKLPLSGGTLTGDLGVNGSTNVPLSINGTEPYIHIVANGASNTAGLRLYPTNGYRALIGNFRASGELSLVASNTEAVFIDSNSIRVNKYRFNGNGTLSGNGTPEIVDMASVGMAMQSLSYVWYNYNATVLLMSLNSLGNLTASGFYEWSDIRYKNVIETNPDISGLGIDVIKFTRHGSDMIRYGYSAQQVQAIIPESVYGTDKLTVNYMDVHTLKIASLERRVKELEEKLKSTL
jgi:hypothetical protein